MQHFERFGSDLFFRNFSSIHPEHKVCVSSDNPRKISKEKQNNMIIFCSATQSEFANGKMLRFFNFFPTMSSSSLASGQHIKIFLTRIIYNATLYTFALKEIVLSSMGLTLKYVCMGWNMKIQSHFIPSAHQCTQCNTVSSDQYRFSMASNRDHVTCYPRYFKRVCQGLNLYGKLGSLFQ